MSSPDQTAYPRFAGIDALRGVSVLLVVLHHIHLRFVLSGADVKTLLPKPLGRVCFWSGYQAVVIFFVLSGFLITSLSLRRWQALPQIEPRAFYWMRAARILPTLLLLLGVLSTLHLLGVPGYVIDPQRSSLTRALVAALGFHVNWLEGTRGYLPGAWDVLWSLSIEETFYVLFPVACLLLRRERAVLVLLLALIVLGPISRMHTADEQPWDEYAWLNCLDGIAFGCLAAWLHARVSLSRGLRYSALALGSALIAFILVMRESTDALGLVDSGLYITVLELGSALTLLGLAASGGERPASRLSAPLRFVGQASYEIYLSHMFVVLGATRLFQASGLGPGWIWPCYALELLASVALGALLAGLYSNPANRALRRFTAVARSPG